MNVAFTLGQEIEDAGDFHCGLASVLVFNRIGFIDKTGSLAISPSYRPQHPRQRSREVRFSDGVVRVRLDGFNGCYINTNGELIGKFSQGSDFHDGLAAVAVVINADGKVVDTSADNVQGYQSPNR